MGYNYICARVCSITCMFCLQETKEESTVVEDQVILDDIKIVVEECDGEIEGETEDGVEEEEIEEEK